MQTLRPHPRTTKKGLYSNLISSDLYAKEGLRSANVEECSLSTQLQNNPCGKLETLIGKYHPKGSTMNVTTTFRNDPFNKEIKIRRHVTLLMYSNEV